MNIFKLYCLCTFIALCNCGGIASAQIVEIPDTNLQNAIRQELNLSDEIAYHSSRICCRWWNWKSGEKSPVPIEEQITDHHRVTTRCQFKIACPSKKQYQQP